jgi:hypothetical protein
MFAYSLQIPAMFKRANGFPFENVWRVKNKTIDTCFALPKSSQNAFTCESQNKTVTSYCSNKHISFEITWVLPGIVNQFPDTSSAERD